MIDLPKPPRLLVSVRSVDEARSALAGGADIIDVKEPRRGSLGQASAEVIEKIARLRQFARGDIPMSVALGEVTEFDMRQTVTLPANIKYAKLGLSGLRSEPGWVDRWSQVREAYEQAATSPLAWIAVIYADELAAHAPAAFQVCAAATATSCQGVLVDTFSKTGGRLTDYVAPGLLAQWSSTARKNGLMFAVAGRLSVSQLPALNSISPDVVAVRSAVCEEGDRQSAVSTDRVRKFREAIAQSIMTPGSAIPPVGGSRFAGSSNSPITRPR